MPDADGAPLPGSAAEDLRLIREAAFEAGQLALSFFRRDPKVWFKGEGNSPVSAADIAVDRMLRERLMDARPGYGWLSEETEDDTARLSARTLFVVDPIDGTRAFIAGKDIWCVSIAIVHDGAPVAGVLVAPVTGEVFAATASGPATRNDEPIALGLRAAKAEGAVLHIAAPERLASALPPAMRERVLRAEHIPSLAYRLAMVADGRLDATIVRRNASDWDIAAADVILRRAGGTLRDVHGAPVAYNRSTTSHGVLIAGPPGLMPVLSAALAGLGEH